MLGEKSQNTQLLTELKLPNPQKARSHAGRTDARLHPEKALGLVTSETVSNYSSESGLFNKSCYISGKAILWALQCCSFEPFIRFALRQVDSHLL